MDNIIKKIIKGGSNNLGLKEGFGEGEGGGGFPPLSKCDKKTTKEELDNKLNTRDYSTKKLNRNFTDMSDIAKLLTDRQKENPFL